MTEDFELANPDRVTLGTVGPVGERVFLLQVRQGPLHKTLKMEKAQVSALARFLGRMLAELERPGELPSGSELTLEPRSASSSSSKSSASPNSVSTSDSSSVRSTSSAKRTTRSSSSS